MKRWARRGALALMVLSMVGRSPLLADRYSYGIVTHILDPEFAAKAAELGVGFVRLDFNWRDIETGKGRRDWSGPDRWVAQAQQRNLRVFATLAYTPGWANGHRSWNVAPTDPQGWYNFVYAAVDRYKSRCVKHWGIWNEPNLEKYLAGPSRAAQLNTYGMLVDYGSAAVKAADPRAFVLGPEVSHNAMKDSVGGGETW